MAEKSFPLENTLYRAEDAQLWMSTRNTGVYSIDNDLAVQSAGGMQIRVTPGTAWLNWARFKGIVYANTSNMLFTIAQADGILNRIDRVVVRYDQRLNTVALTVKRGVPASNPVPPAIERAVGTAYEIALADIRVNASVIQITPANITDTRLNPALCGIADEAPPLPDDVPRVIVGNYIGNAESNRFINLNVTPKAVLIFAATTGGAVAEYTATFSGLAVTGSNSSALSIIANGFSVGVLSNWLNNNNVRYNYMALV
jgi:hypothetical protein